MVPALVGFVLKAFLKDLELDALKSNVNFFTIEPSNSFLKTIVKDVPDVALIHTPVEDCVAPERPSV